MMKCYKLKVNDTKFECREIFISESVCEIFANILTQKYNITK
jgi:hypothetical protein